MTSVQAPIRYLSICFLFGLSVSIAAGFLAVKQPYLGLSLTSSDSGLAVTSQPGSGPSDGIPKNATLETITTSKGQTLAISGETLLEEPDTLGTFDRVKAFKREQGLIWTALSQGSVTLSGTTDDETPWQQTVTPAPFRPLLDLPLVFWLQVLSGLAAVFVGGWVWSLNPWGVPQWALLMSGVGLQFSATAAAIYSTRELVLPQSIFATLSTLNHFGTLAFGLGLVLVFGTYPKPFLRKHVLWLPFVCLALWYTGVTILGVQSTEIVIYLPIPIILLAILGLIAAQFIAARSDPLAKAALRVLGLGVMVGAGVFVMTRAIPLLLGLPLTVSQGVLFPLIFLVYASAGLAVVKYRLFDMPRWSWFLLFYFVGACLLVAVDALLVLGLALDQTPALALSLLVVGFVYLPLRDRLRFWVMGRRSKPGSFDVSLVGSADYIARSPSLRTAQDRWDSILRNMFDPLVIEPATNPAPPKQVKLLDFGRGMTVPSPMAGVPAIELTLPQRGHRLSTSEDRANMQDFFGVGLGITARPGCIRNRSCHGARPHRARLAR